MEHKRLPGDRGTVHYWTSGRGNECVLFTHGATMDQGLFQFQVDYFARDYKVISWDVPSHGLSRPYSNFTLQNAADEMVRILYAENITKAHLVGQSMGGYISQIVATDCPEKVWTITAVDSSPIQPAYYSALDNWLLSITPAILRLYPYSTLIKTISQQIAIREHSQAYALETLKGLTKAEIAEIMERVYQGLMEYQHDSPLAVPILILYGAEDRTGKVQIYCREWARREKRPLRVIPDAAHNSNMDNPGEFNRVLAEFLKTQTETKYNQNDQA